MAKHIILVHGRSFKPQKQTLTDSWTEALRHGIARDYGDDKAQAFDDVNITMAYYGGLSNAFLASLGQTYDEAADVADRAAALNALKQVPSAAEFLGDAGKARYDALPGKTALKEFFADSLAGSLSFMGLSEPVITQFAPDVGHYWDHNSPYGSSVRMTLTEILAPALENNDKVLLLSHSLGTMIAYDVLWKFSHYGEYQDIPDRKVPVWITLGSPLGDETVKRNLKGAGVAGPGKYPGNIGRWINIAAEDDYISHDEEIANDYRKMKQWGLVGSIRDHPIYNLSVRWGESNPHHGAGYLIHPEVSKIVANWV